MTENSTDTKSEWRTPDRIMRSISMRKNKKRRQSLSTLCSNTSVPLSRSIPINSTLSAAEKRLNPFTEGAFGMDGTKKRILSLPSYKDSSNKNNSLSSLQREKENCESFASPNLPFVYLEEDSIQGIFTQMKVESSHEPQGKKFLPLDWTLKRKARFLSSNSFAWCSRTKGSEDANAVAQATRCIYEDIEPRPNFAAPSDSTERSWRVELNKLLTYWQHPSIPWLNLFPRFGNLTKICAASIPTIPSSDEVSNAMHDSWAISFRSILQLTRECLCPYFYLCGQQYTALFQACTINKQNDITCTVGPTTAGLRQLLTNEGIEFTHAYGKKTDEGNAQNTPQAKQINKASGSIAAPNEETEKDLEYTIQSDNDSTWDLINQSIKLNGPKESANMLHAETSINDTIFVKGNANIQLLSNYLVNSKNSITKSGTQANIPPTILAPVAFEGASLKKLTARSGIARSCSESTSSASKFFGVNSKQAQYSLDISGPLLPHCLLGLHNLLANTQGAVGYKAALSTSLYSVPFNTSEGSKDNAASKQETNFGSPQYVTEALQQKSHKNRPVCLNQVVLKNGLYSWND